jgi:hypothetical protein
MEARCQINEHHSETSRAQEEYNALQQRMATMGRWLRNICQRIFGRQDRRKDCFPKSCSKHSITKGLGYEAAWRQDRLRGSHNKTLIPLDIPIPPRFKISAVQCSTHNHHCVVAVACVVSQQATLQNLQRTLQTLSSRVLQAECASHSRHRNTEKTKAALRHADMIIIRIMRATRLLSSSNAALKGDSNPTPMAHVPVSRSWKHSPCGTELTRDGRCGNRHVHADASVTTLTPSTTECEVGAEQKGQSVLLQSLL